MPFLTAKSVYLAAMMLDRLIFFLPNGQIYPRLGTKIYNIFIWRMRISQNLCHCPVCTILFLLFFSALLLLLQFLRFTFLGVKIRQSQEMDLGELQLDRMGYFTTIFAPKLITSYFNLLRQNAVDMQNRSLRRCRYIYPSPTICLSRISGDI